MKLTVIFAGFCSGQSMDWIWLAGNASEGEAPERATSVVGCENGPTDVRSGNIRSSRRTAWKKSKVKGSRRSFSPASEVARSARLGLTVPLSVPTLLTAPFAGGFAPLVG